MSSRASTPGTGSLPTRRRPRPRIPSAASDRRAPAARRARAASGRPGHHRARRRRTPSWRAGRSTSPRGGRGRPRRRSAPSGRALTRRAAYEPRIPTGAAREETRWALYRSGCAGRSAAGVPRVPGARALGVDGDRHAAVHRARAPGRLPVHVWTVDERDDIVRLLGLGRRQRHHRPAGHRRAGRARVGRGQTRGLRTAPTPLDHRRV